MARIVRLKYPGWMLVSCVLAGCAGLPASRGLPAVATLTASRGVTMAAAPPTEAAALALPATPLSRADVLSLALTRNPRMAALYARLGLASAEVYDAGRLANPRFSGVVMTPNVTGEANQVTLGLAQRFTDLLLLPARKRMAAMAFERAQADAGQAVLALAADVDRAWFTLLAAQQLAAMHEKIARVANASAELTSRLGQAGNLPAKALALAKADAVDASREALAATAARDAARLALGELLAIPAHNDAWHIAGELPVASGEIPSNLTLLQRAATTRLDLKAAQRTLAALEDELGVAHRTRWLGETELGVVTERETDRSRITGPAFTIELPLFNHGDGKVLRAQARLELARSELRALELAVEREVADAAGKARALQAQSTLLREQGLPALDTALAETRAEYNYMLESPFVLLKTRQAQFAGYQRYLETLRDYWLSRSALASALGEALPDPAPATATEAKP